MCRKSDPAKAAGLNEAARKADEALSLAHRDGLRESVRARAVGAGFTEVDLGLVVEVDEGRAKGTLSRRALLKDRARLFVFDALETQ